MFVTEIGTNTDSIKLQSASGCSPASPASQHYSAVLDTNNNETEHQEDVQRNAMPAVKDARVDDKCNSDIDLTMNYEGEENKNEKETCPNEQMVLLSIMTNIYFVLGRTLSI